MTTLTLYEDRAPHAAAETITDFDTAAERLAGVGIGLERWDADVRLAHDAADADILAAYAAPIDRLKAEHGYRLVDVVRLMADHPDRVAMRTKFLSEHTHDEDEVRFFVEGSGMFYIRTGGSVHALECTAGDLIVLPRGTRHWFDTGEQPRFTAIRLFERPDGWIASFTGDAIAEAIPRYDGGALTAMGLNDMGAPAAILLDIEGTTSSIAFVHEMLFPYSRARLADYVRAHADDLPAILDAVRREVGGGPRDLDDCVALLLDWHDADRKIAPLKDIQALIWAEGFRNRAFTGHVYPDAVAALRRWHTAGIALYIYSSGSVAAQKLLFGHSDAGDLTPLFAGHFDTAVGGKRDAASYRAIAAAIGIDPVAILFLSDVEEELVAAAAAGCDAILVARGGASAPAGGFPVARTFDDIAGLATVA